MQRVVEREEKPGKGGRTSGQVDLSAAEHVLVETHYLPTSALSSEDLRDWAVVRRVWRGEHVVHMCSLLAPTCLRLSPILLHNPNQGSQKSFIIQNMLYAIFNSLVILLSQ